MHPDFSSVLQKCASQLSLKHKKPALYLNHPAKEDSMSCSTAESSTHSATTIDETERLVSIVSDEDEDLEDEDDYAIKSPEKRLHLHRIHDDLDDNNSLCSELSVGQEHHPANLARSIRHQNMDEDEILDISDTHSSSSREERNNTPSTPGGENSNSLNPFALAAANSLRFPVPFGLPTAAASTIPSNISPFQEEFLRKSHLYAEELMKHQMHLMAAARASAFSIRPHLNSASSNMIGLNPLSKITQLSAAAAAAALTAAAQQNKPLAPHLQQQQNHMHHHAAAHVAHSAAAAAAHQYAGNFPSDTLAKLTALSKQTSASSSHMMSTLNQLQTQMQAHLPGLMHDNNDNLHERALKFSIDNILKADFGRGPAGDSPPQTRKLHHHSKSLTQRQKSLSSSSSSTASNNTNNSDCLESASQIPHSMGHHGTTLPPSAQTFSSSLASICTNSNDSNSTAISSNYSSANGQGDMVKSSPSQTPSLSPGLAEGVGRTSLGKSAEDGGISSAVASSSSTSTTTTSGGTTGGGNNGPIVWPAWVYCTRYSDRPSSGPRVRKPKKTSTSSEKSNSPNSQAGCNTATVAVAVASSSSSSAEDKRPRTAFSGSQLARLKHEFNENRYLTEKRRQQLSSELGLNEAQIKIWFQNKRAKLKKSSGVKNPLALQLMAQGLYNHSTIPLTREEEELQELQEREKANATNNAMQQPATSAVSS